MQKIKSYCFELLIQSSRSVVIELTLVINSHLFNNKFELEKIVLKKNELEKIELEEIERERIKLEKIESV